jgi:DNA transformation protein
MARRERDGFVDFVVEQLHDLGEVEARRMFGGFGLYRAGDFFGIVHASRLYLKTDDRTRSAFLAAGMGPFRPTPRQTLRTYYEVPPDVLEDADELCRWARAAAAGPGSKRH